MSDPNETPGTASPSDPCPICDGTGRVAKFVPSGLHGRPDDPLGDPRKGICRACNGSGKVGGR